MVHSPQAQAPDDPDWVRQGTRAAWSEIGSWLQTLGAVFKDPVGFGRDFVSGQRHALNPVAFLLNSVAVAVPASQIWSHWVVDPWPESGFWTELLIPLTSLLGNCFMAVLAHAVLRLLARPRLLRSTVAMALYASGGPTVGTGLVLLPLSLLGAVGVQVMGLIPLAVFLTYFALMLRGLHAARWPSIIGSVAVAFVIYNVVWAAGFGTLLR